MKDNSNKNFTNLDTQDTNLDSQDTKGYIPTDASNTISRKRPLEEDKDQYENPRDKKIKQDTATIYEHNQNEGTVAVSEDNQNEGTVAVSEGDEKEAIVTVPIGNEKLRKVEAEYKDTYGNFYKFIQGVKDEEGCSDSEDEENTEVCKYFVQREEEYSAKYETYSENESQRAKEISRSIRHNLVTISNTITEYPEHSAERECLEDFQRSLSGHKVAIGDVREELNDNTSSPPADSPSEGESGGDSGSKPDSGPNSQPESKKSSLLDDFADPSTEFPDYFAGDD